MKAKNHRKGAADKKAYVGPRVAILQLKSDDARRVADALGGESPVKSQEIPSKGKTKSSKAGKV
jgi:hypothetical protein